MRHARVVADGTVTDVVARADGSLQTHNGTVLDVARVTWLPPLATTVIGVALNSASQLAQLGSTLHAPPHDRPPQAPVLFVKARNTLTGHLAPVQCPAGADVIQPGASLAVVIGTDLPLQASPHARMHCVRGYTILNDFSLPQSSYYRPPVRLKGYDSFGPLGPWLVDAADVGDPQALGIRTYVNDQLRQQSSSGDLARGIMELIAAINEFSRLNRGDILAIAVPIQRIDVRSGDTVTVEIDQLGRLTNPIVDAARFRALRKAPL